MKLTHLFVILLAILVLSACATAIPQPVERTLLSTCGEPSGCLGGFWHGFTALFQFVGSLLMDDTTMYARCNTGWPYDLGFAIGGGLFAGEAGWVAKK